MNHVWQRALTTIVLLAVAAFLVGAALGRTAGFAFALAGLALVLVLHWRNLAAFERWLRNPVPAAVPNGSGVWEDILARLARLMRQQSQSQQELFSALEELQRATAAMPDGIVILDEQDRIQWCNPIAEIHFALDHQRDLGSQITYLARQPQFAEYLASTSFSEPLVLRQARGQELVLAVQLVPYGNRQKLLISRDITRIERVETMRRDFVANVSHELRTPLTVVGGFLETLTDMPEPNPAILRRSLELMHAQTARMQRLVEDLLTLSSLENAQNLLREEPVNVPELARLLHHEAQSLSGGRHRLRLEPATDHWLLGSADELRSAFSNLVSNAIRYTPEGGEIVLSWEAREGDAVFAVQDSGIGIDPRHIPRLTERFYRVDRSRSRETGGTGLGLAIVKHVVNRHQGRLDITSQPGRGSRFAVAFPARRIIRKGDPLHAAEVAPEPPEPARSQATG
ncbi:MAG: phosphate regulon sensor histidine kinase PhoR [Betaproteobacteria bacterium]|nr:phosphate regulon sensor histidine kinase PhoR [Betaproteobacteria bacterium]